VLGGEPVVHADHDRRHVAAEQPGVVVLGVEVADDEPAAVEVQDRRDRAFRARSVEADGQVADRAGQGGVLDRADLHLRLRVAQADGHRAEPLAGLLRRALGHRAHAALREQLEDGGDRRVQRHAGLQAGVCGHPAREPAAAVPP